MNIRNIALRAGLLRADLVMLPTPETLKLSSRTADADRDGAFGEATRDLHGIRRHLDALYAGQDETYTLYRTADGRVFEWLGQADDHSVHQDDRRLEVLTVRVVTTRPYVDEDDEPESAKGAPQRLQEASA